MMRIGQRIFGKRYEVTDLICEGGQACVAQGRERRGGAVVAIHQLLVKPAEAHYPCALARFQRQARIHVPDPGVVNPIESGQDGDQHYIIFPYIDGPNLEQYAARQGGRLGCDQAVNITRQLAAAVAACHAQGVVHRDIKPANLLLDAQDRLFLIDFGIASLAHEATLTDGRGILGTPHWLAPEQVHDPAGRDARLDLHAIGAVLYFLLTGALPARGQTVEEIVASVCRDTPSSPRQLDPSVPPHLDQLCMRLLEKRPEARLQTAADVCAALQGGMSSAPGGSRYCTSCGGPVGNRAGFCPSCGAATGNLVASAVRCFACGNPCGQASSCPRCRRPFGSVNHQLAFDQGPLAGRVFRIPQGAYVIGRDALEPRDHHLSHRHLWVACVNGAVHIKDAGSVNNTYVDGCPADQPIQLRPAAVLALAGNRGTYTLPT